MNRDTSGARGIAPARRSRAGADIDERAKPARIDQPCYLHDTPNRRLERPARVRSNHWKPYGLPHPDVGTRQDGVSVARQTIFNLN
jgi:hypothetical protein